MSKVKKTFGIQGLDKLTGALGNLHSTAQEGAVIELHPSQIKVSRQVRRKFKNIEELAATLLRETQQSPIIVGPKDQDSGLYPLQKGGRRFLAAELIGNGFLLKAVVDATERDRADHIASQLIENVQREDLTPLEIGAAIVELKQASIEETGKAISNVEVAKRLSKSENWVSLHLGLAELPEDIAALVEHDITTDSELLHSLKLLHSLDPATCQAMVTAAIEGTGTITRQSAREAARTAKVGTAPLKPVAPAVTGQGGDLQNSGNDETTGAGTEGKGTQAEDGQGGMKVPHAGLSTDQAPPAAPKEAPNGEAPVTAPVKSGAAKKAAKSIQTEIDPRELVVGVSVSLDQQVLSGHLLTNRISGDPAYAWVSVVQRGLPTDMLVHTDSIDVVSVAALVPIE